MLSRRPVFRRSMGRPFVRRRKAFLWIRESVNNVTPAHQPTPALTDLLDPFRTQFGINFQLPNFTIWRLIISISVRITPLSTVIANDSVHMSIFMDDREVSPTINSLVRPFSKQYMMWTSAYASQAVVASQTPVDNLYKEFDIRTHRKIENLEQTLWLSLVETGNVVMLDYSTTYSLLLREK